MHPSFTPHFYLQVHRSLFILLSSLHHILFLLTLYVLPYTNRSILVHPSFFPLPFCLLSFNCIFSSFALFLAFIFASSLLSHLPPVFSSFPFHPFLQLFSTPYHPILTSSLLSLSVFPSPFSLATSLPCSPCHLSIHACFLTSNLPPFFLSSLLTTPLPRIHLPLLLYFLPSFHPSFFPSMLSSLPAFLTYVCFFASFFPSFFPPLNANPSILVPL